MKINMKVQDLFNFEQYLLKYVITAKGSNEPIVKVDDGALVWGYGSNFVKMKTIMPTLHQENAMIKPAESMVEKVDAYEKERNEWLTANDSKSEDEKIDYVLGLIEKHGVKEELERLLELRKKFFEEVREVELTRIDRNDVKGMGKNYPGECSMTLGESIFLQEIGILYDSSDN